jgi:integrase
LKRIKSLLSGVFKHAKRIGTLNGTNPIQDVSIPKAAEGEETYAYSLEEVIKMLAILPEPAVTVVATAAFTGMRKGELRGCCGRTTTGRRFGLHNLLGRVLLLSQRLAGARHQFP